MVAPDFRILGPLEVRHDEGLVELAGARQRALLCALLLHAGEVVSSDRLLDDVWGEHPPSAGTAALRVRMSQLRRALGPAGAAIATRAPGYVARIGPDALDLTRFERFVADGEQALGRGDAAAARAALVAALALWRGPALDDLDEPPFAALARTRLEELRLAATEMRIEADLALGDAPSVVGELRALVAEQPLRERLWAQLMRALCRGGRQADALEVYRQARTTLVEELGLEPGPELRALEQRVLAQDPGLAGTGRDPPAPRSRTILVLPGADEAVAPLADLARAIGAEPIVARLVGPAALSAASAALRALREAAPAVRVAAFTSSNRARDALRLAQDEDVALLVCDLHDVATLPADLAGLLERAVCDVALVAGAQRPRALGAPILVPFSGGRHDWAAAELAATLSRTAGSSLWLLGTEAGRADRDASRLLASASLALQRGLGIAAEPRLVAPGPEGVLDLAAEAGLVVAGLSERWAREGLGATRTAIARGAPTPVVLVRRGLRPGALAPPRALTRFTWSLG